MLFFMSELIADFKNNIYVYNSFLHKSLNVQKQLGGVGRGGGQDRTGQVDLKTQP